MAYRHVRANGLRREDVAYVVGSAGGPKALAINGLDRFLFGKWLDRGTRRTTLVGSSISAWRFACAMQLDPQRALSQFADTFIEADGWLSSGLEERGRLARELIRGIVGPRDSGAANAVHSTYDLVVPTTVCGGLLSSDNPILLRAGLAFAMTINRIGRRHLRRVFESVLFATAPERFVVRGGRAFSTVVHQLDDGNFEDVLAATAAIPIALPGVAMPSMPDRILRDGGLLDYVYTDLGTPSAEEIVLMPHFNDSLYASWLDRWDRENRNSRLLALDHAVVVRPSRSFVESLPYQKIPQRKDYRTMTGAARKKAWHEVVAHSLELGYEMEKMLDTGRIADCVSPLYEGLGRWC